MVDFSQLLRKPVGEAKRPPALPVGDYPGVIKGYAFGDNNRNRTPYIRFTLGLTGWPEDADPLDGVDLSKRQKTRDYYLTDDAEWRLHDFIQTLGLDLNGQSLEEAIPQTVGCSVMVSIRQRLNQESNEQMDFVDQIVGV